MHSQARNIDFSQATSTRPFPVGSTLPAVCRTGETYFRSDAPAGRNLYFCTATDTWTPVETAALETGSDNIYTGHNDFSGAASLSVKVLPVRPSDAACDSTDEAGRVVLRKSDSSSAGTLYLCQSTAAGAAEWKPSTYAYGAARPEFCDPGELFFDIDAPAGQQWLGCVSTNTWVSIGGSAALPSTAGSAGKLIGTDGASVSWRSLKGFTDDGTSLRPDGNVLAELDGNNLWTGHQAYPASPTQMITGPSARIVCNRHTVAISAAAPVTLTKCSNN